MFVQETDLVFLLCLQAFKEMLYAAQDQAPSIEGITCMHSHATSCFFHLLQSYLSELLLSCFVLETVVLSCRCKTTRVTPLYLCHS